MPRITVDPNLAICPDHKDPSYDAIRLAIVVASNITDDEAAEQLSEAWVQQNNAQKQAWAIQLQEDQIQLKQEAAAQRQAEDEQQRIAQEAAEEELRELEKKKPKMNPFRRDLAAPDFLLPQPSSFAINKLENFEYVELWYFTAEGCTDAAHNQRTVAEEAFGLTQKDNFISLKPLSSFRASRNVIKDQDLNWRQFETAKTAFLIHATRAAWPEDHRDALASMWDDLQNHEYRHRPHGERTLLLYQARIRKEWHDSLKRQEGFNIAKFNENLLRSISDEVWSEVREEESRT
jgi:hypothetical protein